MAERCSPRRAVAARERRRATCGAIAAWLADSSATAPQGDAVLATSRFLRGGREAPDDPARPRRAPLDRLAAALGLAPVEVDLLLLAGLPEEHEGYAAALRRINPRASRIRQPGSRRSCSACTGRADALRALLETAARPLRGALLDR